MSGLPKLARRSPSGQPTAPSTGPLDAEVVLIGESPANHEIKQQQPFVGDVGQVLDKCLRAAGLSRPSLRIVNTVPCQAPGNRFAAHAPEDLDWGLRRLELELSALTQPKLVVLAGASPMQHVLGINDRISRWRGSLLPPDSELTGDVYNEYWMRWHRAPQVSWSGARDVAWMPTFHPAFVSRSMEQHIWLVNDLKRAGRYIQGSDFPRKQRRWYLSRPSELDRLVTEIIEHEHLVAIDTEMEPLVTSVVSEDEVHVFVWGEEYRSALTRLMASSKVLKVAHNMSHDWRQFEKIYGIPVSAPFYDSIAGAHILEPGGTSHEEDAGQQIVGKTLSPHIATRFTGWPYHKWLVESDDFTYCGMDSVVAYDAYWPQIRALGERPKLMAIAERDHRLWGVLHQASSAGLLVDEQARGQVEAELKAKLSAEHSELERLAWPHVEAALAEKRLRLPHLFRQTRSCECCRGAKLKRVRCWACAGFPQAPKLSELKLWHEHMHPEVELSEGARKADYEEALLGPCEACDAQGSTEIDLGINLNSSAQVGDLFYRALRIPARRYKGTETVNFAQLERLLAPGQYLAADAPSARAPARELVERYVGLAKARSEYDTVVRLTPGDDGRIRTVFDLWYTPTHRVASRESLHDMGSNLQNIPKAARRFIVADAGFVFLNPDYKQIEGRAQAVLSQDAKLMEIYTSGGDSHQVVAELVSKQVGFSVSRQQAKRVSFAGFYGIEAGHLATILGISEHQASLVLRAFFQLFQGAERYKTTIENELRTSRSVTSPTGWRRRWLGYVLETRGRRKGQVRAKVKKEALASGPQEMGSYVMQSGVLQMESLGLLSWIQPRLHVHDSMLFSVPRERAAEAIEQIEAHMHVEHWGMEFPIECIVGPDWGIASLDDNEKEEQGGELAAWTRGRVLAQGCPS